MSEIPLSVKKKKRYEIRYRIVGDEWTIWAPCTAATAREYKNSEFAQIREVGQ